MDSAAQKKVKHDVDTQWTFIEPKVLTEISCRAEWDRFTYPITTPFKFFYLSTLWLKLSNSNKAFSNHLSDMKLTNDYVLYFEKQLD